MSLRRLVPTVLLVLAACGPSKGQLSNEGERLVELLEAYHAANGAYPETLDQLEGHAADDFPDCTYSRRNDGGSYFLELGDFKEGTVLLYDSKSKTWDDGA